MPNKPDLLNKAIDADIRVAQTLPTEYYREAKYFELAKERVFARSWLVARSGRSGSTSR